MQIWSYQQKKSIRPHRRQILAQHIDTQPHFKIRVNQQADQDGNTIFEHTLEFNRRRMGRILTLGKHIIHFRIATLLS